MSAPKAREGRSAGAISPTPSTTKPYWACPDGACEAIVDPAAVRVARGYALPAGGPLLEGGGEKGGYDPQDLQSAYGIPTSGSSEQTIALIEAFGYGQAEVDLAKYRERYGLEPCTTANGCFRKVNEKGEEANYPTEEKHGWLGEAALDMDMASAACPHCHILLVEATTQEPADTAESVNTAARLGATEISNSYGYPEDFEEWCKTDGCAEHNAAYDHPGILITASAGDSGYNNHYEGLSAPNFPATSPYVVAVGGTALRKASNTRGWSEEVWNEQEREAGTGSGCSRFELKPAWQTDKGCTKRTDNDVAAVAACATPVSVYASAYGGWENFCGTSAAAPLFAGIEAHASAYTRSFGAKLFYRQPGLLFDVTAGSNGTCTPPAEDEYLCHAEPGYDGATGLGTPNGVPAAPSPAITKIQPTSGPEAGGTAVTITGTTLTGATEVKFGSTNAINFEVVSETEIKATSPAGSGTVDVTVSTPAGTSATSSTDRFAYTPPQIYKNGNGISVTHGGAATNRIPLVGSGELKLEVAALEAQVECVNLGFGSAWNESEPAGGHAQILSWWASAHTTTGANTELGSSCRFVYQGAPAGEAWVSAEPPLGLIEQEAVLCANSKQPLNACLNSGQTLTASVIREVIRKPLSLPWNVALTANAGSLAYAKLGVPTAAGKTCAEESAPEGCVVVDVIAPALNLQLVLEGALEPRVVNGTKNGLSPSTLEFKGAASGHLHLRGAPNAVGYLTGTVKLLGLEGQELITVQ
ncbi:MAG: IPT/TIG domain-containing protein [Solirubrobacteraceae bacterium]